MLNIYINIAFRDMSSVIASLLSNTNSVAYLRSIQQTFICKNMYYVIGITKSILFEDTVWVGKDTKPSSDTLNFSFYANMNGDSEDDESDRDHAQDGQDSQEVLGYEGETQKEKKREKMWIKAL